MASRTHQAPLPASFLDPWLVDNTRFIDEAVKQAQLVETSVPGLRARMQLRKMVNVEPVLIGAVDAAVASVILGDQLSIIIQTVHADHIGHSTLGQPIRFSGVNGHEMALLRIPARLAAECELLAASTTLTIADTSYWSMLMEVNQAITHNANSSNQHLKDAVKTLVTNGVFLHMLRNSNIVPMSKLSESDRLISGVSDREVYGRILAPGEFTLPQKLVDATKGAFGVEKRMFRDVERREVEDFFKTRLGVLFFKPHSWSRAFRIEAHLKCLNDDSWLMPLLNGIAAQTLTRAITEPYPQFMADHVSKQISAVAALYGTNNRFRLPLSLPPIRTGGR